MAMNDQDIQEIERETRSSITFKRTAKMEPYWDAKLYFESGSDEAAMDAIDRLQRIDEQLRSRFINDKQP